MTFEEMAAQRDPLYAATMPVGDMYDALFYDRPIGQLLDNWELEQARALLRLAIRALRDETL